VSYLSTSKVFRRKRPQWCEVRDQIEVEAVHDGRNHGAACCHCLVRSNLPMTCATGACASAKASGVVRKLAIVKTSKLESSEGSEP